MRLYCGQRDGAVSVDWYYWLKRCETRGHEILYKFTVMGEPDSSSFRSGWFGKAVGMRPLVLRLKISHREADIAGYRNAMNSQALNTRNSKSIIGSTITPSPQQPLRLKSCSLCLASCYSPYPALHPQPADLVPTQQEEQASPIYSVAPYHQCL